MGGKGERREEDEQHVRCPCGCDEVRTSAHDCAHCVMMGCTSIIQPVVYCGLKGRGALIPGAQERTS